MAQSKRAVLERQDLAPVRRLALSEDEEARGVFIAELGSHLPPGLGARRRGALVHQDPLQRAQHGPQHGDPRGLDLGHAAGRQEAREVERLHEAHVVAAHDPRVL